MTAAAEQGTALRARVIQVDRVPGRDSFSVLLEQDKGDGWSSVGMATATFAPGVVDITGDEGFSDIARHIAQRHGLTVHGVIPVQRYGRAAAR